MITACRFFNRDGSLGDRFFVPSHIPDYLPAEVVVSPKEQAETASLLDSLDTLLQEWEAPIKAEWNKAL